MAQPRALVVGAGGISNAWFPPLRKERVDVVGVVDLDAARAQAQVARHELKAEVYTDLKAALAATAPDFVVDLTTPNAHAAVTIEALNAGCHVIGEKPMAASMAEARRMVRAAERNDRLYMVSQSRRWIGQHAAMADAVAKGRIGTLTTLNCAFYIGAHFGGFRDEMESPLLLDMAIHQFDLARFMSGCDPVAVYAKEFNPHGSWYKGDVAATCVFEMTNGVVFTFTGSWCAEGCHTSWNGDWRFIGDRGTLLLEGEQPPHGQVVVGKTGFNRKLRDVKVPVRTMKQGGMHGALREMLAYLRTGRMPQTHGRDNIQSLAMVFAAIESSRKGRRVPIRLGV